MKVGDEMMCSCDGVSNVWLLMGMQSIPEQNIHYKEMSAFQKFGIVGFHCM